MNFHPITVLRQYYLGILGRYRAHYSNGKITTEMMIYYCIVNFYSISCLIIVCVFNHHLWLRAHWGLFLYGYPARQAPIKLLCT